MMTTNSLPKSHNDPLKRAGRDIQRIFDNLNDHFNPNDGRVLSMLNVTDGIMLAWVTDNALAAMDVAAGVPSSVDLSFSPASAEEVGL
jgi:hypothetical protein